MIRKKHRDMTRFEWRSLPLKKTWMHTNAKGVPMRTEVRLDTTTGSDLEWCFPAHELVLDEPLSLKENIKLWGWVAISLIILYTGIIYLMLQKGN